MNDTADMGVVVRAAGGPEALRMERAAAPGAPGAGEVRIVQRAIGVNFIDTYFRSGLYPWPSHAADSRRRGCRRGCRSRSGGHGIQGGRPRRLHAAVGRLSHAARGSRRAAGQTSRGHCFRRGRVGHAQGVDGAISAHLLLPGQGRRHRAGARSRGRRRVAAGAVAEGIGCDVDRHGGIAREGGHGQSQRL